MIGYGILFLVAGIAISIWGYKVRDKIERYNFENRTDGGVVQYKNYSDTKKHGALGCLGKFLGIIGLVGIGIGSVILIIVYTN